MAGPEVYNLNENNEITAENSLGNDIEFDISQNSIWLGSKVINVSNSAGDVTLNIAGGIDGQVGYTVDGDDLIINIYGTKKDYWGDIVANSSLTIGTIRLVDGATSKFDDTKRNFYVNQGDNPIFSTAYSTFDRGDKSAEEKQILKGSYLSEKFYCGKGNDEIYTGDGGGDERYNEVHLNTGNAVITLDKNGILDENIYLEDTFKDYDGDDSYWIPQEAVFSKGGSTLINATGKNGEYVGDTVILAGSHQEFYRKGNDLCIFDFIVRDYQYYSGKNSGLAYEARLNIKDYFIASSKVEIDGYTSEEAKAMIANTPIMLKEGKGTLKGTFDPEAIVAKAKSTIYTKGGYDDIYLSTGNDTVIVDGEGHKTIFASGATGHNTVIVKNKNADIDIEYLGLNPYRNNIGNPEFDKKGNDLVIKPGYGYSYASAGYKTSSVTVKDYFKNYYDISLLGGDIEDFLDEYTFTINGNAKKKNTLYGTNYDDSITGGNKKDVIYTGSGDDTIKATAGGDKVVINGEGSKTINITNGDVTIDRQNSSATVFLETNNYGEPFQFLQKSKNDLIVRAYWFDGSKYTERKAVIKNAFNPDGTVKDGFKLNNTAISSLYSGSYKYISGKGTITLPEGHDYTIVSGSAKNDTIYTSANVNRNIIFAGNGKDKINLGDGSNVVLAEDGNDTITAAGSSSANNNIYAGKGNDTINIVNGLAANTLIFADGDGKDTININTNTLADSQNIQFKTGYNLNNNYSYSRTGDNLVITKNYKDSKGKVKSDTLTINDYFNKDYSSIRSKVSINGNSISGDIYAKGLILKGTYNKKQKITYFDDTSERDIVIGTSKKDYITFDYGYYGYNSEEVTPGKGNDTILVADDHRGLNINLTNGDGNDTLIIDEAQITNISYTMVNIKYTGNNAQGYTKDGNDLVIHNVYESKGNIKTDSIVIQDYFDSEKHIKSMTNGSSFDYRYYNFAKDKITNHSVNDKALIVTGTKADTIEANNEAIIYSGKGNDKITVKDNAQIYAGKGNDTITIDGGSLQNVELNVSKGDGNDTIVADSEYNYLTINLNGYISDSIEDINFLDIRNLFETKKFGFKTSGEDLVFYRPNGKKQETITFKGALASGSNFSTNNIKLNFTNKNDEFSISMSSLADGVLPVIGKKEGGTMVYTGADDIGCVFNYSGKGKALMNGGNGDDTYIATLNKNSKLLIADRGTNSHDDSLKINAKSKDVCLYFDVELKDGKGLIGSGKQNNELFILNKNSLNTNIIDNNYSGTIEIGTYFGREGTDNNDGMDADDAMQIYIGSGKIENVQIKNEYIDMEDWIYQVGFEVAQWMSQNGKYDAASTYLKMGTQDEIQALLAIYKNNTADMYAMDMNGHW